MARLSRALLLGLSLVCAPVALAATYDVTTDRAVDVLDRTVQQGSKTFEISAITRADPGEMASVAVTAPCGEDARLYIYKTARQSSRPARLPGPPVSR